MQSVKWCPHCQSPTGVSEIVCPKCGYEYRLKITIEAAEPLVTFTPHALPHKKSARWRKAFPTLLAILLTLATLWYQVTLFRQQSPLPVPISPAIPVAGTTPETVRASALELYKIRVDMTGIQVLNAVGAPTSRQEDGAQEVWHYARGPYFTNCWIDEKGYVSRVQGSLPPP